jgi:tRNA pseudouridine55 synthase
MIGALIVNKDKGMTSHDTVSVVRRLLKMRRIGHTGTLDPMATGVLILLLGPATRLTRFLKGLDKTYRAVVRLGEITATYDTESEVLEHRPVDVTRGDIEKALTAFRGRIMQTPPMYSAIRHKGKRLYDLARKGESVDVKPRPVTIEQLEIVNWASPNLTLNVRCSSGTYIRSLAHDIGQALGCGGHLYALTRTANGPFTLDESHTVDALYRLHQRNRFDEARLPPSQTLRFLPKAVLNEDQAWAVRHGQRLALDFDTESAFLRACTAKGTLICVLKRVDTHLWQPKVVLPIRQNES